MDKTPKERIVFDEGVYYGDEGSEISIEDIACRLRETGRGTRHRLTGTRRPLHRVDI